jgi:LEA14-like dessication related protein
MKKGIIISLIIIAIITAIWFAKKQYDKAMKYCFVYNIKRSRVKVANAKQISIDLAIDYKNTADITFEVDGYDLDILLNGKKVANVKSTQKVSIKANDFTTLIVPINVSLSELLKQNLIDKDFIKNILLDKSKIVITTTGKVSGGALGIKAKDFPISIPITLAELMQPSTEPEQVCK